MHNSNDRPGKKQAPIRLDDVPVLTVPARDRFSVRLINSPYLNNGMGCLWAVY